MITEKLTSLVKEYATQEIGFDLIGIADALDQEFSQAPKGHKPAEYLAGARAVVVGGREVLNEMLQTTPSPIYLKHYEQMNLWLSEAADRLARFLCAKGFKAMWFPETDDYNFFYEQRRAGMKAYCPSFSHIRAATAAGLGARGKVGIVLTPRFGPRQRWISVITTAPLIPTPKFEGRLCMEQIEPGSCGDRCIKVCHSKQSGALRPWPEEGGVDMFRCNFGRQKSRGRACGMCIKVCPVGKK
jgi:epoxyqueuosine reductase QueG